ncbi:MAG TPA: hypothetical protein VF777_02110 [Phycisphaerales bacterium]
MRFKGMWSCFGTGAVVLATLAAPAFAAPAAADVRRWFESEAAAAKDWSFLASKSVKFRTSRGESPKPEEVAALRRLVEGKPDHPARSQLLVLERRLKNGPDVSELTVLWLNELRFRVSTSNIFDGSWIEQAADRGVAWTLSESGQLLLRDKDSGENYTSTFLAFQTTAMPALRDFVFGGIGEQTTWNEVIDSVQVTGNSWRVRCVRTSPENERFFVDFKGTWDDTASRGFVQERLLIDAVKPNEFAVRTRFEKWTSSDCFGRPVASQVFTENSDPDFGNYSRQWVSCEVVPAQRAAEIVAVPRLNSVDPLRGNLQLRTIYDVRPSKAAVSRVLPDGTAEPIRKLPASYQASDSVLQTVGWVVLAVSVIAFLAVRLSRRAA